MIGIFLQNKYLATMNIDALKEESTRQPGYSQYSSCEDRIVVDSYY